MNLGDKIKNYRELKGWSQKELGIRCGFAKSSADVRIAQYESNKKRPREKVLNQLANALEIDVAALMNTEIYSYKNVIEFLLSIEQEYGLLIEEKEGKAYISFDERNSEFQKLNHSLLLWKNRKEQLINTSGESKEEMDNYEIWKSNIFYGDEEIIGLIALLNKYIENPDACNRTAASRIGSRIRFIRTTKGLSQAELGEKVELSSDRIQKYENGARKPKLDLLKRIADALNVSILALIDPSITTYENIMYALFELVNQYGAKLEKGDHKMCLTVDFREVLYDYLMEWYEQYLITIEEVKAANSDEEKRKILTSYYNWEWNYPDGIDKEINKRIQRARIKKVIEKLENELKALDGSEEENDS